MKLTVVLPTYNEAENLNRMVDTLLALAVPGDLSILVVDDNSPDGTGQMADELAARMPGKLSVLHRAGKLGLGTAYIEGFHRALEQGADYVLQMDCDFSHDPKYIPQMIEQMERCNCDIVIGSRYVRGQRGRNLGNRTQAAELVGEQRLRAADPVDQSEGRDGRLPAVEAAGSRRYGPGADSLKWLRLPGRNDLCGGETGIHKYRSPDLLCRSQSRALEDEF
jgi:glycosyltransferase involved in cell wall biosynthesis